MPRRLCRTSVLAVTGALVGVLAFLLFVPVPQVFVFQGAVLPDLWTCPTALPSSGLGSAYGILTTKGTSVTYHWSAPSPVTFAVVSCEPNGPQYGENGTGGSGTFVSPGGIFAFGVGCAVGPCVGADVWGTYTGPLLVL